MMSSEQDPIPAESETAPPQAGDALKVVRSEDLFAGERIVVIDHGGALYRLQITARGRLILQK